MDQHVYLDIMDTIMLPFAEYEMPLVWACQEEWRKSCKIMADIPAIGCQILSLI